VESNVRSTRAVVAGVPMNAEMPLNKSRTTGRLIGRLLRSNAFAWSVSILLHGVLFMMFYKMGFGQAVASRRFIIPEARLVSGPASVVPMPGPARRLIADKPTAAAATAARAPRLSELPILSVATVGAAARDVVVSGPPALALPGVGGAVTGLGATGVGGGGTVIGPVSRFFGQAGNAYKVVYVVDVSASLMIYMDDIMRELQDSIRDLIPTQEFHIVLAMPRQVREMEPRRLVPANARYKGLAYDLIKTLAANPGPGEADPIDAMRRAFGTSPELIYFLSDGDYGTIEADLLASLKRLNARGDAKITVIGFGWKVDNPLGEPVPPQKVLLERIAREHGGHCRFVDK
jgi:hypothetical protein